VSPLAVAIFLDQLSEILTNVGWHGIGRHLVNLFGKKPHVVAGVFNNHIGAFTHSTLCRSEIEPIPSLRV
jgi:hypothetical protein